MEFWAGLAKCLIPWVWRSGQPDQDVKNNMVWIFESTSSGTGWVGTRTVNERPVVENTHTFLEKELGGRAAYKVQRLGLIWMLLGAHRDMVIGSEHPTLPCCICCHFCIICFCLFVSQNFISLVLWLIFIYCTWGLTTGKPTILNNRDEIGSPPRPILKISGTP